MIMCVLLFSVQTNFHKCQNHLQQDTTVCAFNYPAISTKMVAMFIYYAVLLKVILANEAEYVSHVKSAI
jgi:hypothetical protein